jgi:hypothetical protein
MFSLVSTKVGPFYITFSLFLTLDLSFRILGALMGFRSFVESFVVEALDDDLGMIYNLLMFANFQVDFAMFIMLCLVHWLFASYNVSISNFFVTLC